MSKQKVFYYTEAPNPGGVLQAITLLLHSGNVKYERYCIVPPSSSLTQWIKAQQNQGINVAPMAMQTSEPILSLFHFIALLRLLNIIRSQQPALCHFHLHTPFSCLLPIILLRRFSRCKIVVTEHYLSQLRFLRARPRWLILHVLRELVIRLNMLMKRLAIRATDHVIVLSEGDRHLFLETFPFVSRESVSVVYNGIDVERMANGRKKDVGFPEGTSLVLTVADLNNQKGHRYLIDAIPQILREYPAARFAFAGDGHLRSTLEQHVRQNAIGQFVAFLGRRDDIPDLLASADLFVLPSVFEGMPLSVMEAMAAGKAVVATNVPGTSDIVQHMVTGILVEPADSHALAKAIIQTLKDSVARENMGRRARERVQVAFTADQMRRNTQQIYERLLSQKGS